MPYHWVIHFLVKTFHITGKSKKIKKEEKNITGKSKNDFESLPAGLIVEVRDQANFKPLIFHSLTQPYVVFHSFQFICPLFLF